MCRDRIKDFIRNRSCAPPKRLSERYRSKAIRQTERLSAIGGILSGRLASPRTFFPTDPGRQKGGPSSSFYRQKMVTRDDLSKMAVQVLQCRLPRRYTLSAEKGKTRWYTRPILLVLSRKSCLAYERARDTPATAARSLRALVCAPRPPLALRGCW